MTFGTPGYPEIKAIEGNWHDWRQTNTSLRITSTNLTIFSGDTREVWAFVPSANRFDVFASRDGATNRVSFAEGGACEKVVFLGDRRWFVNRMATAPSPEPNQSDAEVMRVGMPRSELIISGQFAGSAGGGGGTTSRVMVNEVLKTPKGFQAPKTVAVHWLTSKSRGVATSTNFFLFFLRPAGTNAGGGYNDVTGKDYPFIRATDANMRFLRSQLLEEK